MMVLASSVQANEAVREPALDILRQVGARTWSASGQSAVDAMLTTGSVVKHDGVDRVLYHLPINDRGVRFAGEESTKSWPIEFTLSQLAGKVSLRLALKNAVSVMPEASHITIFINGQELERHAIQSPDRSRLLSIDVPSQMLVPGVNALTMKVRQRHRVDCSVDATHELWVDIDPTETGFIFERGNSTIRTLDDLAVLARNKAGQVRIRMIVPDPADKTQVARSMELVHRVALRAGYQNPLVDVAAIGGKGPGLDIYAGTREQLRTTMPDYANSLPEGGPVQIISRDGLERVALIVLLDSMAASSEPTLPESISAAFTLKNRSGSAQGLALLNGEASKRLVTGAEVPLQAFGVESERFNGRLFRTSFDIELPADTFIADYDRAELKLAIAYAAGLSRGAKSIVRVNGVTVAGFGLPKPDGDVFRNKSLRIPISNFRPGTNVVEVEARLPKKQDEACAPQKQIADTHRFVFSARSTLRFPHLAYLARVPDLHSTISGGFPYIRGGQSVPTVLSVARAGYAELSAAASLTTGMVTRSGVMLDQYLTYEMPPETVTNAIIVGAIGDVNPTVTRDLQGFDADVLRQAWEGPRAFSMPATIDVTSPLGTDVLQERTLTPKAAPMPGAGEDELDPLERFILNEERDDDGPVGPSIPERVATAFDNILSSRNPDAQKAKSIDAAQSDFVITQRLSPNGTGGVWTIVMAPQPQNLRFGVDAIASPDIQASLDGPTAALSETDRTVTSAIAGGEYVQLRAFTLSNTHLVVAGWFARNHFVYTGLMLFALLGLGILTNRTLKRVGEES